MRRFPEEFTLSDGVWVPRDDGDLVAYSDGAAVESELQRILDRVADPSSDSPELRCAIRDWPTRYYLSVERTNILRALTIDPDASVLELGCGCGALTRYLGENVAHVTAVEGSAARARIARSRCRELRNVEILSGSFEDLTYSRKFDVVTLIGVLEYAAQYGRSAGDAFEQVLDAARGALAKGGVLVLAIENRLGLKYFSGCGEDHGLPRFNGIEGYPGPIGPRTFSRGELDGLMKRVGLLNTEFLLPFPDYKLPSVVINADATDASEATALNLVDWCRQPWEQYDGVREYLFSDHLALHGFATNGLLAEVANSFLVLASPEALDSDSPIRRPDWIARKMNSTRRRGYRTTLTLSRRAGVPVLTREREGTPPEEPKLTHCIEEHETYLENSESLSLQMLRALRRPDDPREAYRLTLQAWCEFLERSDPDLFRCDRAPRTHLDCTPDNLLIRGNDLHFIDAEWTWHEPVDLDWLFYRGLRAFWHVHAHWVRSALAVEDLDGFVLLSLSLLGRQADAITLERVSRTERELQEIVNGPAESRSGPAATPVLSADPQFDRAAWGIAHRLGARRVIVLGEESEALVGKLVAQGIDACVDLGDPGSSRTVDDGPRSPGIDLDLAWITSPDGISTSVIEDVAPRCCELLLHVKEDREIDPETDRALRNLGFDRFSTGVDFAGCSATLFRRAATLAVTLVSPTSNLHGGTYVLFEHAKRLALRGHRVTVASLDPEPPRWFDLSGVRFIHVSTDPTEFETLLPDADLLIASLWATAPLVARAPFSKGRKAHLVQGFEWKWAGEPDSVDEAFRLPLRKICVSTALAQAVEQRYGERADVVLNGCDLAGTLEKAPIECRSARLRIGMLYHEDPVKGFSDGLSAFRRVHQQLGDGVELVLYGARRPAQVPEECGEFHVNLRRRELSDLLDSLDIFVSPSRCEGFGLPALEAMSRGLAVVVTDSLGCRDYTRDGAALVSEPGEPKALAQNLLRVCEDATLRQSLAARGIDVSRRFTWSDSSETLETVLLDEAHRQSTPLEILYVGAGPVWFDTFLDPWLVRGLRGLGHEVTEFHPAAPDWRYARRFVRPEMLDEERLRRMTSGGYRAPSEIPEFVRRTRPDLVLFNHGLLIPATVLNQLRGDGVPTAAWMIDEPQEVHYSANRGRLFDYVFLQDRGSLRHHRQVGNADTFFLPHGADPRDHRQRSETDEPEPGLSSDVLLIGTGFPARQAMVRAIAGRGFGVRVVGRHWDNLDLPNVAVHNRPVPPDEAARLYRNAKISLNLHRGGDDWATGSETPAPQSPNGSFFHIAACGSLQMVDREYPGACEFLAPGRQYAEFDAPGDLVEKIEYLLGNETERARIAKSASIEVHARQTYGRRLADALETIGRPRSGRRIWGLAARADRDREVFDLGGATALCSVVLHASGDLLALQRALLGLANGQPDPHEVLVAHPPSAELGRWLDDRSIPHQEVGRDRGMAGAFNEGLRQTNGEVVVFVSEGALATTHVLRRLTERLEDDPTVALVGPSIHPEGGAQRIAVGYSGLAELENAAREIYLSCADHYCEMESPDPLCFAVRRSALEQIGSIDERYPSATVELDDLCLRLRNAGWRVGWTSAALAHRLVAPIRANAEALARAKSLFDRKWNSSTLGASDGPARAGARQEPEQLPVSSVGNPTAGRSQPPEVL